MEEHVICPVRRTCDEAPNCGGSRHHERCSECGKCPTSKGIDCIPISEDSRRLSMVELALKYKLTAPRKGVILDPADHEAIQKERNLNKIIILAGEMFRQNCKQKFGAEL